MRRKTVVLHLCFLFACFALSAVSLEDILSSAMANSPNYRNIEVNYQNGLLSLRESNLDKSASISVSASLDPLAKSISGVPAILGDGEYGISLSPNVTITLPNGDTKINGAASYGMDYKAKYSVINASMGLSHVFDFTGLDEDSISDLSYAKQDISLSQSFASSTYTFKKSVISAISQLLTMENTLETTRNSLKKSEKAFADMNALGTVSPQSATYKNQERLLESARDQLATLERQYDNAKSSYKDLTGLDWSGISDLAKPQLEVVVLENGNTDVYLKALDIEIAEANYDSTYARLNPSALSVGGTVSGGYLSDNKASSIKDISTGSLNISATGSYTGSNWSLSVKPGVSMSFPKDGDAKTTASVTISGTYANGSLGQSQESEELTLSKLKNAIVAAENSYINALSSYMQQAQSLSLRLLQWEFKCTQYKSELDYLETLHETQSELFSLGLTTEEKLRDAEVNLEVGRKEWNILMLEGESLRCDIEAFAL